MTAPARRGIPQAIAITCSPNYRKDVGPAGCSDHRGSGAANRSFADGFHHAGTVTSYAGSMGNIEGAEWKFPIRYLYRRRMTDSAGAGKFRGGATSEVALTPHGVDEIALKLTNTAGTEQTNAHGIDGGYPGAGSQSAVVREADPAVLKQNTGKAPDIRALGGTLHWLPSKADEVIRKGDVYGFWAAGGGGFGDPLDRTPTRIGDDIAAGTFSRGEAERLYGVVIDNAGNVDDTAPQPVDARSGGAQRLAETKKRDRCALRHLRQHRRLWSR